MDKCTLTKVPFSVLPSLYLFPLELCYLLNCNPLVYIVNWLEHFWQKSNI